MSWGLKRAFDCSFELSHKYFQKFLTRSRQIRDDIIMVSNMLNATKEQPKNEISVLSTQIKKIDRLLKEERRTRQKSGMFSATQIARDREKNVEVGDTNNNAIQCTIHCDRAVLKLYAYMNIKLCYLIVRRSKSVPRQ